MPFEFKARRRVEFSDTDMAGTAIDLASRAGDYVVGETIAVDGGVVYGSVGRSFDA